MRVRESVRRASSAACHSQPRDARLAARERGVRLVERLGLVDEALVVAAAAHALLVEHVDEAWGRRSIDDGTLKLFTGCAL